MVSPPDCKSEAKSTCWFKSNLLHHIIRLYDVLDLDVKVHQYSEDNQTLMMDIKRGRFPGNKEAAFALRDEYLDKLTKIYDDKKLAYYPQEVNYEALDSILIKHYVNTYKHLLD